MHKKYKRLIAVCIALVFIAGCPKPTARDRHRQKLETLISQMEGEKKGLEESMKSASDLGTRRALKEKVSLIDSRLHRLRAMIENETFVPPESEPKDPSANGSAAQQGH